MAVTRFWPACSNQYRTVIWSGRFQQVIATKNQPPQAEGATAQTVSTERAVAGMLARLLLSRSAGRLIIWARKPGFPYRDVLRMAMAKVFCSPASRLLIRPTTSVDRRRRRDSPGGVPAFASAHHTSAPVFSRRPQTPTSPSKISYKESRSIANPSQLSIDHSTHSQ
jgi:hypothetical protein